MSPNELQPAASQIGQGLLLFEGSSKLTIGFCVHVQYVRKQSIVPETLPMADVTQILSQFEAGDHSAAEHLLPLVYNDLRKLAAARLAQEKPGQTLQATALVHEAYLRLVGNNQGNCWDHRGHFFAAAAEAMRRIVVEQARRKRAQKAGSGRQRVNLSLVDAEIAGSQPDILALSDALDRLESKDERAATGQAAVLCRDDRQASCRDLGNFNCNCQDRLDLRKNVAPRRDAGRATK